MAAALLLRDGAVLGMRGAAVHAILVARTKGLMAIPTLIIETRGGARWGDIRTLIQQLVRVHLFQHTTAARRHFYRSAPKTKKNEKYPEWILCTTHRKQRPRLKRECAEGADVANARTD